MPIISIIPDLTEKEVARFMENVPNGDGCWEWQGNRNHTGYGRFKMRGKRFVAHRIMFEISKGRKLATDTEIDHACHSKACVNPAHLRETTRKQNMENHNGALCTSKSGVRGVSWRKKSSRWVAQVSHNNRVIHVGYFLNLEDADEAVRAKRNELQTHNDADRSHPDRVAFSCPEES